MTDDEASGTRGTPVDDSGGDREDPGAGPSRAEPPPTRGGNVREVLTVLVLSLTAVLTAWCGFQYSKWGGEMSIAFSQASTARIQSVSADGQARDARSFDLVIYAQYVNAMAKEDTQLVAYISDRFTPAFRVAFDDWIAHERALPAPFSEPSYAPPGLAEAKQLSERADAKFQKALDNNARGDRYSLLTVLFALVLFFAAMSGRNWRPWAAWTFFGVAVALAVVGVVIMSTYPVII
ncbi:MAG: hypothetical protein ABIS35_02560 [Terracoccus sp.]